MTVPLPLQYATIRPWLGVLPAWVPLLDQVRVASYARYEDIYWSSEEGFSEVMRGDNDNPVFMPTARMIVDTVNRYTAPGFGWRVDPLVPVEGGTGDDANVILARLAFDQLFKRERFLSKFNANKRRGIIRGDWLFHILGDDTKPLGRRLKIMTVEPASYFPVYESDIVVGGDPERLIKVHLAEVLVVDGQERVSRLTYERIFDSVGTQTGIQVSHGIFKMDEWAKGTSTPERVVIAPKLLPPDIPAIPIYHLKNLDVEERYGSSEMRGLESDFLAINQTISDEDLTLAMDGVGIYATDGGAPVDANGNEVDWIMGPGRVLTNANGLRRINGAGSITPYGEHYERLVAAAKSAIGISDVSMGRVDSATAESGIALLLQLGPILAYTLEKDQNIIDVMTQMFHDLCFWLQVYEELPLIAAGEAGEPIPVVRVQPTVGVKIPVNPREIMNTVINLRSMVPPLISLETAHKMLRDAGIPIQDDEVTLISKEQMDLINNLDGAITDTASDERAGQETGAAATEGVVA